MRTTGVGCRCVTPVARVAAIVDKLPRLPKLAEVWLMPLVMLTGTVDAAGTYSTVPETSQSPAVRLIDVILALTFVVSDTPLAEFGTYSPTLPALALLFVVVPTMPAVCDGVMVLEKATAPLNVGVPLSVPDNAAPLMVGDVSVLFVSVSVVARPTSVSVEVGRVSVPVLTMLEKLGVVSVGDVAKTRAPEPVSSETMPRN
jgi:hypothetical protein